jgi:hypothetical protein
MRLTVGGEQAAIEPGEQAEPGELPGKALPLFPGLVAEACGAGRDSARGSRLGMVEPALAALPRSLTTLLGRGFRPRIGVSPLQSQADE